jgi:DNA excision repair protein ERCC-2
MFMSSSSNHRTHKPFQPTNSLQGKTALEVKPLKFAYSRLNSLLRTLEVTHLDEYNPLQVGRCAS